MSIDSISKKSINQQQQQQSSINSLSKTTTILSSLNTPDSFDNDNNNNTKNGLNKSIVSSTSTTATSSSKNESQNDSLSNDHNNQSPSSSSSAAAAAIIKNETTKFHTIITTQSDHPYSSKSKRKITKNIKNNTLTTTPRTRKRKRQETTTTTNNCLKKILLNNNLSAEKIAIFPIKVDLHHDSSKILFVNENEIDSDHCLIGNKKQKSISKKMARENHPTGTANLMGAIPNNHNGNSCNEQQKNITFVQHYQHQQQQLQQPPQQTSSSSSFGQGNLFMMNNQQFISTGNNNNIEMAEIISNNNLPVVGSCSFADNRCDDNLNSSSSFHSLPPVQTILNNSSGSSNNLQNFQSNINDFNTETSFNFSFENDLNFNFIPDPILDDDLDITNGKYLEYGLYSSDDNNCNNQQQQISSLLPLSSSTSPNIISNGHDLYNNNNSAQNIMPEQSNGLSYNNHNHLSLLTSDPFIDNINLNNDLSNFGNNEYIEFEPDLKNEVYIMENYFDTKKQKSMPLSPLLNGNNKHIQEMTLTQLNSMEIPSDNHNHLRRSNKIWSNGEFGMDFNANQQAKVLLAKNNIAIENNGQSSCSNSFVDDSVLFCQQQRKIQQQQQQSNLFMVMQQTNDTSSTNNKGSFGIQENVINQSLPRQQQQNQYSSPQNLQGQQPNNNNIAIVNDVNRQTINFIANQSELNSLIVLDNRMANNLVSLKFPTHHHNDNINNSNDTNQNISQTNNTTTISCPSSTIPSFPPNRMSGNNYNNKLKESCTTMVQMIAGLPNNNNDNNGNIITTMIATANNRIRNDSMSTDISDEGFASHSENDSDDNSDNNSEMMMMNNMNVSIDHVNESKLLMVDNNNDMNQNLNPINNIPHVDCKEEDVESIYDMVKIEPKQTCENNNVWITNDNDHQSKASNSSVQAKNSNNIDENDDSEDEDDDESFFGDYNNSDLLNATISDDVNNKWSLNMGRSRKGHDKRYFWQYNVQSKGPKGPRQQRPIDDKDEDDPHVLKETTDPVFAPDCQIEGVKHSGKARKGDGNDLTANPTKLLKIGLELKKLGKILNRLTPVTEVPMNCRNKSRKEKNKLASRACRLKKKAQHEANKIKLHGLKREHGRLIIKIQQIRCLIEMAIRFRKTAQPQNCNLSDKFQYRITSISDPHQILQQINNRIDAEIAGKTADFVNQILENVTMGINDGGIENY
ncbi:hypothetical protein HUG17_5725 [Dermatophagoides farinae]|uniref:BZIP domain-containing protein n=4 Tax=Dermatophagoides farinae TaxID=6954 RepID=A0A9D4P287_DERFA|nr:hypothetical protein HUG17_5725 [Dermatophagoides farinae]